MKTRSPAVAGGFYPAQPARLAADVHRYLDRVKAPVTGELKALIAPHAGYMYCGDVAATAFGLLAGLPRDQHWRVIHLGPCHGQPFAGAALSPATHWLTPLGRVPVEHPAGLLESPLILLDSRPHEPEHCLEVQVPFMQKTLGDFSLVPLVTGRIDPAELATLIEPLLDEATLVVASTDLSHFHRDEQAREFDQISNAAIAALDIEDFQVNGDACGKTAVLTVMQLARQLGWRPRHLAYATSGDQSGDRLQVVGYTAFAFTAD